jgi:RimK family alpha-L-glutamate ligase
MYFYHIISETKSGNLRASDELFIQACSEFGLEYLRIDPKRVEVKQESDGQTTYTCQDQAIFRGEGICFRSSISYIAKILEKYLDKQKQVTVFNSLSKSLSDRGCKMSNSLGYTSLDLHVPKSYYLHSVRYINEHIQELSRFFNNKWPLVIKPNMGSQGRGVQLVESISEILNIVSIEPFPTEGYIVQELVKSSHGKDIRAIVLGDSVLASVQRINKTGDFRSNVSQGGEAFTYDLTASEKMSAIEAVKQLGGEYGGVDLMFGENGPVVTEVNYPCGLKTIHPATGISVPHHIVKYLLEKHKNQHAEKQ